MSIQLKDAISSANTFGELGVIAKQLEAKLSFWGYQYVVVAPKNGEVALDYQGSASIYAVLNKVELIMEQKGESLIQFYSGVERETAGILEGEITRIFVASGKNVKMSNILTRILACIRQIFSPSYESRWFDDACEGHGGQILSRDLYYYWNNERKDYFNSIDQKTITEYLAGEGIQLLP